MSEKKTTDNLLEIAQKMAEDKLKQEKQHVEERISNELNDVKKAVEMVRSGLCYAKRGDGYSSYKRYVFATEDMLIEDYLSEPTRYEHRGIYFTENRKTPYDLIFIVNGIHYYDIRYILNAYEEDVRKEQQRITGYNDQLNGLIREFERLLEEHKAIKNMLEDWKKRQTQEVKVDA